MRFLCAALAWTFYRLADLGLGATKRAKAVGDWFDARARRP